MKVKNYVVSYDLNGRTPTHVQMDAHIRSKAYQCGRILETVWFVRTTMTTQQLTAHIGSILSPNDRLMVVEGRSALFQNLLINDQAIIDAWNGLRAA